MNRFLIGIVLALIAAGSCRANIVDERELEEIYAKSNTVVYGTIRSASLAKCGGRSEVSALYVLRVRNIVKGSIKKGDIKVCVQIDMPLSGDFIVAGDIYGKNEVVAGHDAIVMETSGDFYRLISDDPFRDTAEGEVYAIGKHVPDFMERFGDLFRSVKF